jgi:hypothetical protein
LVGACAPCWRCAGIGIAFAKAPSATAFTNPAIGPHDDRGFAIRIRDMITTKSFLDASVSSTRQ